MHRIDYFMVEDMIPLPLLLIIILPTVLSSMKVRWSPRTVDTRLGVVQGYITPSRLGQGVEVFVYMPFASPPTGNLRFMPPVSAANTWEGVRRSENFSPVCPQVLPDISNETEALKIMPKGRLAYLKRLLPHLTNQSEDCLYLNLYVPLKVAEGEITEKLPVLVFIHGDDYGYGSGNPYDPSMLVSYGDIIVITLNYRLGIFGDRTNVTVHGQGKGATLVNFLMISNAVPTGLLFHRVILSSGSALSPSAKDLSAGPELSKRFALRVRCPTEPSVIMLECLREVSVTSFLESELWSLFAPSGDGIVVKNDVAPEALISNKASHYPLLLGVVKVEALPTLSDHDSSYGMEDERRREILRTFINKHYRYHRNEILAGAIHEYTEWERAIQHPQNVREETLDALGDVEVVAPMTKLGDLHSQSSRSRAFFYVFEYQSKTSDYQQKLGCVPGEDILYMWGVPLYYYDNDKMRSDMEKQVGQLGFFPPNNYTWNEVQLSLTVMRLWINFVRLGNPNGEVKHKQHKMLHESLPSPISIEWPLYDSFDKKYLLLDLRPRVKSHYRSHKLSFWNNLVPDYQRTEEEEAFYHHHHLEISTNNTKVEKGKETLTAKPKSSETHNSSELPVHDGDPPKEVAVAAAAPDSGESQLSLEEESPQPLGFGYSTALSVTIAIGVSLLILNILIFATFYYEREKRLSALRNEAAFEDQSEPLREIPKFYKEERLSVHYQEEDDVEQQGKYGRYCDMKSSRNRSKRIGLDEVWRQDSSLDGQSS